MAGKKKDAGSDAVLTFRLPRELHRRLVEASAGRSVSEEMRRRLEASFAPVVAGLEDPRFRDLLTAIGHAAAAAAKMPAPREGRIVAEGRVVRYQDDITPYAAFMDAAIDLLHTFEPEGVSLVPDQTQHYENRLAEANEYLLTLKMQLERLRPVPPPAPRRSKR